MSRIIDITGKQFGQWTVVENVGTNASGSLWLCRCTCGREFVRQRSGLVSGNSTRCRNCANKEKGSKGIKHGKSRVGKWTYLYRRWASMKRVCHNQHVKEYEHYGGRGIQMYEPWLDSFEQFEAYVIEAIGNRPQGMTLDRIDNDGHYEPGNIRWATMQTQCRNRRSTRLVTFNGETRSLIEWAEHLNMRYGTLVSRFQRGWDAERVLTTPSGQFEKRARRCGLPHI